MAIGLKALLRDLVPKSAQVPIKFWLDRVRGYLEPEMALLDHLVRPGDHVIDVGGNRGIYAFKLWKLGAVVEIFEPNPTCLAVLDAWTRGRPRVALHPVALSDRTGSASLHIPIDDAGVEHDASASVEHDGFARTRDQPVALKTLDSYAFKNIALIKIDVEGHESSVIAGSLKTLSESRPALLVEIEQRHCNRPIGEVFADICTRGYRGYFLSGGRLHPLDQFEPARDQASEAFAAKDSGYINNFLFLHEQQRMADHERDLFRTFGGS